MAVCLYELRLRILLTQNNEEVDSNVVTDALQGIRVELNPTASSTPTSFSQYTFVLEDFNAHNSAWLINQQPNSRQAHKEIQFPKFTTLNNPKTLTRKLFNLTIQPFLPAYCFAYPNFVKFNTSRAVI